MRKSPMILLILVLMLAIILAVFFLTHVSSEFPRLSKWKQSRIDNAWESLGRDSMFWAESPTELGNRYYGCYEGYDIFFFGSGAAPAVVTGISVGNFYFGHSSGFGLYAHRNGEIIALEDLYEAGKISDRSVATAAKCHRAYERAFWTERNTEHNERFPNEPRNEIPSWATEPTK